MKNLKKFEHWNHSDKLSDASKKTGIFDDSFEELSNLDIIELTDKFKKGFPDKNVEEYYQKRFNNETKYLEDSTTYGNLGDFSSLYKPIADKYTKSDVAIRKSVIKGFASNRYEYSLVCYVEEVKTTYSVDWNKTREKFPN